MGPSRVKANNPLQEMRLEGGGHAGQTLALPVSPLELKTGSGGAGFPSPCSVQPRETVVDSRQRLQRGVSAHVAGSGPAGAG